MVENMKYRFLFICFLLIFTTSVHAITYDEYIELDDLNEEFYYLMVGDITNSQHYASSCSKVLVSKYANNLNEK